MARSTIAQKTARKNFAATLKMLTLVGIVMSLSACSDKSNKEDAVPQVTSAPSTGAPPTSSHTKADEPYTSSNVQAVKAEDAKIASGTMQVLNISERNRDGRNAIAVTFSQAIDVSKNVQSYFSIQATAKDAQASEKITGEWVIDKNLKIAWFNHIEPRTSYKITVQPGVPTKTGSQLLTYKESTLTTRPLQPSISFDSTGSVLPMGFTSGLPVTTVDIDQIDVDFFRVKPDNITGFLKEANKSSRRGWYADRLAHFGELAFSGRFKLDIQKHTRTSLNLDLSGYEELNTPGLYLAIMRQAGKYNETQITWFSITDIGIQLRQYAAQWDVHLSSLTTGKPLKGIKVQALDKKSGIISEQVSDDQGKVHFLPSSQTVHAIVATSKNQYTVLTVRKPALDLSEFDIGSRPYQPTELFLFGPRDLYRPGETISVMGLLRDHDGKPTQSPTLRSQFISATQTVANGFLWQPTKPGYYETQWTIPEDAKTGQWTLRVQDANTASTTYTFNVEQFLPERLKLTLANAQPQSVFSANQTQLTVPVQAEYLYGAPASGNRMSTVLNTQLWREPIESLKGYQFGNILTSGFAGNAELKDQTLNDDGQATVTLTNQWREIQSPLKIKMITSVYESGGRPITRTHPILYWPTASAIGIRPHFGNKNPDSHSTVSFDLVNADQKGDFQAAEQIEAVLIKEDRQYFWENNNHQGWHWNWSEKEFPVDTRSLSLPTGEKTELSLPVDWGNYRLEVTNIHTGQRSSIRFYAGYNWYADWQNSDGAAPRPDRINLSLDKPHYPPGDTALLKVMSPSEGALLVLVESDKPLWSKKIQIGQEAETIEIPVSEDWNRHDIYISAYHLQETNRKNTITPKRSLGLLHLPLDRSDRKLMVSLDAPAKSLPNQPLLVDVQVSAADGSAPESAYVNLAAVDVGVLNITKFTTPDPHTYFFEARRYATDIKDMYSDLIESNNYAKAKFKFGGDADLSRGGESPKSEVQIVSLTSGLVELDSEGKAQIPLELPDFNGRLRLMAVTHSTDSFGSTDQDLTVAAELVAEIAMPRFLATDDISQIALDLRNMTDVNENIQLELKVSGAGKLIQDDQVKSKLQLSPNQKQTVLFDIVAVDTKGQIRIDVTAVGNKIKPIHRTWRLGVRPAYPAQATYTSTALTRGEAFSISEGDFPGMRKDTLEASLNVSTVVDLQIAEQLNRLLGYPYGCLEQTTSRALPLLYANEQAQKHFNLKSIPDDKRRDMIQKGIDRVLNFQKNNGSFGLWGRDSDEEHWLTVYATDFLLQAQQHQFSVPQKALTSAIKRLQHYVDSSGHFFKQRWSSDSDHYAFATKAYAGYVLSQMNQVSLGSLRTLYNRDFDEAQSGLSQLHLAIALKNMGDHKLAEEAEALAVKNIPQRFEYWGDYGSKIRDVGLMIHNLIRNDLSSGAATKLAIDLRESVQDRQWLSTQEQIALFFAGLSLQTNLNANWLATLQIGDVTHKLKQTGNFARYLNSNDISRSVQLTSQSEDSLFVNAILNAYPLNAPEPSNNGMKISKTWYTTDGQKVTPTTMKSGDAYIVHLAVSSEQRNPNALVVDLLPAGLELENQNFEEAIKLDDFKIDNTPIKELQSRTKVAHQEFRDDRYVAAIALDTHKDAHLFYIVRAVSPGTYQVPAPMVEDMYRPYMRSTGATIPKIQVVQP